MQILSETEFRVSAQVMAEFVNVVRRKATPPLTTNELSLWLDRLEPYVATPVDATLVRRGTAIAERFQLNYYDGAILAAAERLGCDTVISEDMTDGQNYGRVTVQNPFREG
jgi:predicted nucleic acid-binding protein